MCVIRTTQYIHPNGERRSRDERSFCDKSDGYNPCYHHVRKMEPTVIIPDPRYCHGPTPPMDRLQVPALTPDDSPSPLSSGGLSTPRTATAGPPLFQYVKPSRSPKETRSDTSKRVTLDLGGGLTYSPGRKDKKTSFSSSSKKTSSSRGIPASPSRRETQRGRKAHSGQGSYQDGDTGAAGDLKAPPGLVTPLRTRRRGSWASQLGIEQTVSMRRPKAPLARSDSGSESSRHPSLPRLTSPPSRGNNRPMFTDGAVDGMLFDSDHDDFHVPDARAALRTMDADRRRRQDAQRAQEETDRAYAEQVATNEAAERARDEYSTRDYQRIEAREEIREMNRRKRESEDLESKIREQLASQHDDTQEQEDIQRALAESRREQDQPRQAVRDQEEAVRRLRVKQQEQKEQEDRATELEVQRILRRDAEAAAEAERQREQYQKDAELRNYRRQMLALEERRLSSEISDLECQNARADLRSNASANESRRPRPTRPGRRSSSELGTSDDDHDDDIRSSSSRPSNRSPVQPLRRILGRSTAQSPPLSPRSSTSSVRRGSLLAPSRDIRDAEYRRRLGERVLNREEAVGRAIAAAEEMNSVLYSDEERF